MRNFLKKDAKILVEPALEELFTHNNILKSIIADKFYKSTLYQQKIMSEASQILKLNNHNFFGKMSSELSMEAKVRLTVK